MLEQKLNELEQSDIYPFHMPGHKRAFLPFANPYAIDITEIEGFDNLHHATGILQEAQQKAADENKAALRRQIEEHKRQELENRRSKKLELEQEVRREAAGKEERREEKAERPIDVRILSRGGNER